MRPSEEGVKKFQLIYEELYGREIDVDAAREMASRILTLYELLARPLPEEVGELPRSQSDHPPSSP
jgi:hypothetical protein